MKKGGTVYILTNKRYGVLYTGVTSNLPARMVQHRSGEGSHFTQKYNAKILIYYEQHDSIQSAIAREKAIKAWKRMWKIRLVEKTNPSWNDLFEQLNS